jgi:N-acetylgalactosamine-6-sulfatase
MNPDNSRVELYDIPRDPTQIANIADKHPDIVARLSERVLAWNKTLPTGPTDPGAGQARYPWPAKSAPARAGN